MPAAIPVVAAESVLAAEVLAAEAAAAAAAEAAAVEAASVAAAEAAATAAAEQAAAAAATEAATTAATTAGTQAATGIEALTLNNPLPGQLTAEQISAYTSGIPQAGQGVQVAQAGTSGGIDALLQAQAQATQAAQAAQVTPAASAYAPTPVADGAYQFASAPATPTPAAPNALSGTYQTAAPAPSTGPNLMSEQLISNAGSTPAAEPGFFDKALDYMKNNKLSTASMGLNALNALNKKGPKEKEKYSGPLSKFKFDPDVYQPYEPEQPTPYQPRMYNYAGGGPVEMMSNANAIGANTGYPMADINKGAYATPYQTPISRNVLTGAADTGVNPMTGEMQFAGGGISSLGGYSDYARGGRMLKGPGDGMSDNIPATIAGKQPARLANEEFVVPADVVSHLGNGSSEAGAKALYKMMDRVRQARTGNKKQGKQINPEKYLA
jgi:hypothetical protein